MTIQNVFCPVLQLQWPPTEFLYLCIRSLSFWADPYFLLKRFICVKFQICQRQHRMYKYRLLLKPFKLKRYQGIYFYCDFLFNKWAISNIKLCLLLSFFLISLFYKQTYWSWCIRSQKEKQVDVIFFSSWDQLLVCPLFIMKFFQCSQRPHVNFIFILSKYAYPLMSCGCVFIILKIISFFQPCNSSGSLGSMLS